MSRPVLADWLDLVNDGLRLGMPFPHRQVAVLLLTTFQADGASYVETGSDGVTSGWAVPTGFVAPVARTDMPAWLWLNPLYGWYRVHQFERAQLLSATVRGPGERRQFDRWAELGGSYAPVHQLALPLRMSGLAHRTFVVARADEDFEPHAVGLAESVRRLLRTLEGQVRTLAVYPEAASSAGAGGLTTRQVAVLLLVAQGRTADAIGRRLEISPRTVHKHLQAIYERLGVHDRVSAVVTATRAGWLADPGGQRAAFAARRADSVGRHDK